MILRHRLLAAVVAPVVAAAVVLTAGHADAATTGYASAVQADHPAAYLRLDDAGTTAADFSGHGRAGTIAADAIHLSSGALVGETDGALQAGPTNPSLALPADGLPGLSDSQTVELWVKGDLTGSICGSAAYLTWNGLSFYADNGCVGGAALRLADSTGNRAASMNQLGTLTDGAWHQIAYAYDASNKSIALYVDGVLMITTTGITLSGASAPLRITYGGAYDELAVYSSALTPARIAAHFSAGQVAGSTCAATPSSGYEASALADSPARLYALDETNGSRVALDASGNCFNGSRATAATTTTGAFVANDRAILGDSGGGGLKASATGLPTATQSQTVEMWVKGNLAGTICGSASYVKLNGLNLAVDNGCVGGAALRLYDTTGNIAAVNDELATLTDDSWHQVGYSYDAGAHVVALYVDGVQVGVTTGVTPTGSSALLETTYSGGIDDVTVYPSVVPPARMAAHFTAGLNAGAACTTAPATGYAAIVKADGATRYYPLDEPTGARVASDLSENCLNGSRATAATSVQGALTGDLGLHGAPSADGLAASSVGLPTAAQSQTAELWVNGTLAGTICGSASYLKFNGLALTVDNGCVGGAALRLSDANGSQAAVANQLGTLTDGTWHQVAYTYDATAHTVVFYVDGAAVGTVTGVTLTGGAGPLRTTYGGSVDDLAIYPKALSAARISEHYGRALAGATGAVVEGTIGYDGHGAAASRVQACTGSATCTTAVTDNAGHYRLIVAPGTYGVTAFPPASGDGSTSSAVTVPLTVGADEAHKSLDITLPVPALPPGASLTSPSLGTQTGVPTVFWGESSTLNLTGCANGTGFVYLAATDTGTGQVRRRFFPLREVPTGSGKYVATIPPLAPLHGTAQVVPVFNCAPIPSFTPTGGDSGGGTLVLAAVPEDKTVTGFTFGGHAAASFHRNQPHVYAVTSPAGAGDAALVVTFNDGTSRTLGTFHYSHVSSVSSGNKAGDVVTVTGTGFTPTTQVIVGSSPAPHITYVSPTRVDVTLPESSGASRFMVASDGGVAEGPEINYETVAGGIKYLQSGITLSNMWGYAVDAAYDGGLSYEAAGEVWMTMMQTTLEGSLGGVDATLLLPEMALAPEAIPLMVAAVLAAYAANQLIDALLEKFDEKIDPSGTVVDGNGTPVAGASVTLLSRDSNGDFAAVPSGSDRISPTQNPETTGDSGAFHWDAVAGTYKVAATSATCLTTSGQPASATTGSFVIPPPKLGLVITLPCTAPAAPAPTVTAVSPGIVPDIGGATLTVSGTDLGGTTAVTVGGRSAPFIILSPYALSVVAPAGTSTAHVVVTTSSGTSPTGAADTVRYLDVLSAPATSAATVTATGAAVQYGQAATVSATVTRQAGGAAPTGTVTVTVDGATSGSATLDANGKASLMLGLLAAGSHNLVVAYSGDTVTQPSQTTLTLTVRPATPALTVTTTKDPAYGQPVTLTAAVAGAGGGAGPTGSVTFTESGRLLGKATVTSAGRATLTLTRPAVGTHKISAAYSGDTAYAAITGSATVVVSPARTTTTLTATPSTARYRTPVTLKAHVTSAAGIPTGVVTFTDGGTVLGRRTLSGGNATVVLSSPLPGSHHLTASYGAQSPYASSSATATLVVTGRALALTTSSTHVKNNSKVTLTGHPAGSWPSGTRLKVVGQHGRTTTYTNCGTGVNTCTVKISHSSAEWVFRVVAFDAKGHALQASAPVYVFWTRTGK